jgi:acyl carrier protein
MTYQEFLRELEDVLEMPSGSIKGTEKLADLAAWESMAAISFIAMADSKLGASVSADKLATCQSVADLATLFPGKVTA